MKHMLKYLSVFAALTSTALSVHAATPTLPAPSQAQLDSAKSAGLAMGNQGSVIAPVVGANGNLVPNGNGVAVQPNTSDGLRSTLQYFQQATGLSGVSPQSSPANGPQAAGIANVATTNSGKFNCANKSNNVIGVGSLSFMITGCTVANNTVTQVTLRQCDARLVGGACSTGATYLGKATADEFGSPFTLNVGSFAAGANNTQYGIGCTQLDCLLTVKTLQAYGGGGDSLLAGNGSTGQGSSSASLQNSVVQAMGTGKTGDGQSVSQFMTSITSTLKACSAQEEASMAQGKIVTCQPSDPKLAKYASDTKEMSVSALVGDDDCGSGAKTSVTNTVSYNKTCTQSIPLTERITYSQMNGATLTCRQMVDANGTAYPLTKSVLDSDLDDNVTPGPVAALFGFNTLMGIDDSDHEGNGCGGRRDCGDGTGEPRSGYVDVPYLRAYANADTMANYDEYCRYYRVVNGKYQFTDKVTAMGSPTLVGQHMVGCVDGSCYQYAMQQYWTNPLSKSTIKVEDSPTPVSGQCSVDPDTTNDSCAHGGWFGRYLTEEQCTVTGTDSYGQVRTVGSNIDYTVKAGCGVCIRPVQAIVCQGTITDDYTDGCADVNPKECTFVSSKAVNFTSGAGFPMTVEKTFKCQSTSTIEASAGTVGCTAGKMTQGLSQFSGNAANAAGFNEAMVSAAVADQSMRGMTDQAVGGTVVPRIFGGEYGRCYRPEGFFGGLTQKNCCDTGLQRPKKGNVIKNGCDLGAVKLAANRRSGFSVFIGDWCSQSIKVLFSRKCIERAEGYCMFPGMLPRLVQEQGRAQLASFAYNATADATKGKISFTYSGNNTNENKGEWSAPVTVGGAQIAGWRWPGVCSTPESASKAMINSTADCPSFVSTYVAVCESGNCEALPESPIFNNSRWEVKSIDPLKSEIVDITRYVTVKGGCDTRSGACAYDASVWPIGVGGKAYTTRELNWQMFSLDTNQTVTPGDANTANRMYNLTGVGNMEFRGYGFNGSLAADAKAPTTIPFEFSTDATQTWTKINLPTSLKDPMTLPGTDITLVGSCDPMINMCSYRMRGSIAVTAKPWGSAESPDCSGFTAGQLAVLDFGKMDLSAFTASVMSNTKGSTGIQDAAAEAAKQASSFTALMGAGKVAVTNPTSSSFLRVSPPEGMGPFTVSLKVASAYPDSNSDNRILKMTIDWDDCKGPQAVALNENGVVQDHTYEAPDSYACKGSPSESIDHTIKVQVQTMNSGSVTSAIVVRNAWSNLTGFGGTSVSSGSTLTTTDALKTPSPYGQ